MKESWGNKAASIADERQVERRLPELLNVQ
jgi:hypothetical protein